MTYKVVPLVLQGSEGAAWLPAVWSDTYTWTFQGVLNGWELGCQFTILFSIKQHPLEDAGYAGIVTHPWNLTWIHAGKDLSNILNSIATLYVHPWNDMETKKSPIWEGNIIFQTAIIVFPCQLSFWCIGPHVQIFNLSKALVELDGIPPRSLGVQC